MWPNSTLPAIMARDLSPNPEPNCWLARHTSDGEGKMSRKKERRGRHAAGVAPVAIIAARPPSFYCPVLIPFRSVLPSEMLLRQTASCMSREGRRDTESDASPKILNSIEISKLPLKQNSTFQANEKKVLLRFNRSFCRVE